MTIYLGTSEKPPFRALHHLGRYPIFDLINDEYPGGVKHFVFPDGQHHWEIQGLPTREAIPFILARVASGDDLLKLMYLADALWACGIERAELALAYVQGARMDRRIQGGTFSAKVITRQINSTPLTWERVFLLDPHSDVLPAFFDRPYIVGNEMVVNQHIEHFQIDRRNVVLVAPDAGASKKVFEVGKRLALPVIQGHKHRDTSTGALSGFSIEEHEFEYPHYIIVDDICDGGGTFAGLAEAIRNVNYCGIDEVPVDLVVSHGIFSKGLVIPGIDRITTTDSFKDLKPMLLPQVHFNVVPV